MADNVALPGTGASIATDDVSGVQYQVIKIAIGSDGSATLLSSGNPMPVSLTSVPSHAVTNAGTFAVQIDSFIPGTASTQLGKAEDAAHVSGDTGVMALFVRNDAGTALAGATGDYIPGTTDATGALRVTGSGGTSIADATTYTRGTTAVTPISGVVEVSAPVGLTAGKASAFSMTQAGELRVNISSGAIAGVVDDAAVAPGVDQVLMAGYTLDDASTDTVNEGDAAFARVTPNRKQISQPYESEANTWSYAAPAGGLVSTVEVTAKASAGAALRNYITGIDVTNSHPTIGSEVQVLDGTGGTVLHRGYAAPAGGGYVREFLTPLRGTVATIVNIKEATGTASTGILVNLQGYVGV